MDAATIKKLVENAALVTSVADAGDEASVRAMAKCAGELGACRVSLVSDAQRTLLDGFTGKVRELRGVEVRELARERERGRLPVREHE
ncbi:MAG: hypothetical protein WCJ30_10945, partial [Deltaproteobacteria bacterium]